MWPQNHIRKIIPRKFQYKGFELFMYFHFSPKLQIFLFPWKISCLQNNSFYPLRLKKIKLKEIQSNSALFTVGWSTVWDVYTVI